MRSSAFLGALLLIVSAAEPVFAADDPLLKQTQSLFEPIPLKPPPIKDVAATPAILWIKAVPVATRGSTSVVRCTPRFGVVEKPGADFSPPGDKGRFEVTKAVSDDCVFRVPPLRNIELTPPYFHTGLSWDLHQVVAVMGVSQLGQKLTDDEISKITAYLKSLTGEQPQVKEVHRNKACLGQT